MFDDEGKITKIYNKHLLLTVLEDKTLPFSISTVT
jgi:hypothetical protein